MKLGHYPIQSAVFICGAAVMIFELLGSRLAAPFLGNSLLTWTALIGVIMASLAIGYWLGGKLADQNNEPKLLCGLIFISGLLVLFSLFNYSQIYLFFAKLDVYQGLKAVIAAILVFAPASIIFGAISPYAAKLLMSDFKSAGQTVGSVSALSTAGSILGTFASGFFLIPFFGSSCLLWLLAAVLLLLSLFLWPQKDRRYWLVCLAAIILLSVVGICRIYGPQSASVIEKDTPYSHVKIFDFHYRGEARTSRLMMIDSQASSARYLGSNDPVFDYTQFYRLADFFKPDIKRALMLGGAAYTVPRDFLDRHPQAVMDVVEIDPGVTEIAKNYFELKDDQRMDIIHQDGRFFLNSNKSKYDAIFGDAFGNWASIPWQLTTREAVQESYDALADDGVVVLNMIGSIEGDKGRFVRAEYRTYREIFPQVWLFPITYADDGRIMQNIMLVATKSNKKFDFSQGGEYNSALSKVWVKPIGNDLPVLTDNYAPVDWYLLSLYQK